MNLDDKRTNRLEKLFDVQMWAWGCDARHPGGNLFAVRGMHHTPPPAGTAVSSTWREVNGEFSIQLSSAGVTVSQGSTQLTLTRGPLSPQLRNAPIELLPLVAAWVLNWEAWVDGYAGPEWRVTTLTQRRRASPWNAAELREEWGKLDAPKSSAVAATRSI